MRGIRLYLKNHLVSKSALVIIQNLMLQTSKISTI